jgi:regulator of sigma E protease
MIEWISSGAHYIVSFALVISVIVFIHEFGHFLAARLCGVKIEVFSIGFGRELLGRTDKHGTRWKIALWPLGGFVKMYGDAGAASTADSKKLAKMTVAQKKVSFHYKPLWAKAIIVAAGPVANFLLAIAVFTYFIFTVGIASTQPIVGDIIPDSPAAHAGLQVDDRILTVNHRSMHSFNDIPDTIATNLGTPVTLEVKRGEETFTLKLTPKEISEKDVLGNEMKRPLIGIRSQQLTYENVGLLRAVGAATAKTYDMCATSLKVLGQMITGKRSADELKGPIGIAKLSGDITQHGDSVGETLRLFLWFVALLSVNLGMVNLFPIPMLDGGHLLFYAIEALRGRPLAEKVQEYSFRFGVVIVGSLMAFTLFNDMRQLFS